MLIFHMQCEHDCSHSFKTNNRIISKIKLVANFSLTALFCTALF